MAQRRADSPEQRILDACKCCCERWGFEKVTIDDIAAEAGVSRATLYRMFPGGKDVLFEAMRVQELDAFFNRLLDALGAADGLEDLLVAAVSFAMADMRADEHLAVMLSTAPGETLGDLTVGGMPRIIRTATAFLTPVVEPHLGAREAAQVVELLVRLVISGFLAPSDQIDLANPDDTRRFIRKFVLPAYQLTDAGAYTRS
jgi:AcrR family transcriptional regulator